jgi:hypothetical protein
MTLSPTGKGSLLENPVNEEMHILANRYHFQFIFNPLNHNGFDLYVKSREKWSAVECKNYEDHYVVGKSWLNRNVYDKQSFKPVEIVHERASFVVSTHPSTINTHNDRG